MTEGRTTRGKVRDDLVDDLNGLNHNVTDVHASHEVVTLFAKKKRLPLNEEKCIVLPINVPDKMATPVLYVNNRQMDVCETCKYLGDIFNTKGSNSELIEDRVSKGMKCMLSTMALACEITLGIHLIKTQLSLYKVMFIPVVMYNSGAWSNITIAEISKLRTIQLKFLKRILHAPSSTANCFIFLELGIIPIEFHIHINQLQFLHHVLSLPRNDPVNMSYHQQQQFKYEKNWVNEVQAIRRKYDLKYSDEDISTITKER